MPRQALFAGLISDEANRPVEVAYIGGEPCYVVDDAGFRRHIPAEQIDRQILDLMREQISGNEDLLSAQAAKMFGSDDIFSKAIIENQLKNIDQQFENLFQVGIPEEARAFMGMSGFRVVINIHGEIVHFEQPSGTDQDGGGE